MKLMYAPPSPFARKVRVAAIELGLADDIELVLQAVAPAKENADYAAKINPLRKIPVLLLDDGRAIYDSTAICEYLDDLAGGGRIIPAPGPDRWDVLTQHALAQGMMEAAVLVRYETWLRPEEFRWPDYVDDQWDRIESGLDWFESNAKGLEGPANITHFALGSLLGYLDFRWPDADWREGRTRLTSWAGWVMRRGSFKQTEPKDP
jgi:glutathione S-transferase